MGWMEQLAAWWVDYLAMSTVLLVVVLAAGRAMRQPVQRMAMAWSSSIALLVLAVCFAFPVWPKLAIVQVFSHSAADKDAISAAFADTKALPQSVSVKQFLTGKPKKVTPVESLTDVDLGQRMPQTSAMFVSPIKGSSTRASIFVYLTAALVCGATLTFGWLVYGQLRARWICRQASSAPEFAQRELRSIVGSHGVLPRLLVSSELSAAGAIGLWRPAILLPAELIESRNSSGNEAGHESELSLRAVLAHELAHIERGDLWLLAIRRLLLVVLFAHPLYWLSRRRVLADQEMLADCAAAEQCGRHRYAECMVAWARQMPRGGARLDWALGIWERPSQLTQRITMLLNDKINLRTACSRGWWFGNASSVALLAGCLSLFTLNPTPRAKAEPGATKAPAVTATTQPAVAKATQAALPTVSIVGECTDEWNKSIANAHVMLFRAGDSSGGRNVPMGRATLLFTAGQTGAGKREAKLGYSLGLRSSTEPRLLAETDANAAGRFRFTDLPVDENWRSNKVRPWVVAQAKSRATTFADATVSKKPDGKLSVEPVKMALAKAESLRGRITNGDGKPIVGAVVWCPSMSVLLGSPRPGIMCAVTDANGHYEVNDLARFDVRELPASPTEFGMMKQVSLTATVEHPDYAEGVIEYTKVPATIDLVLQRPASLLGRVTFDGDSHPAAKARIQLQDKNSLGGVVETDREGNFFFPRVVPGKYTFDAELSGRLKHSQQLELVVGDNRLDLQLGSGGFIKGRVIDNATGKPPTFDRSMPVEVHACRAGQPLTSTNTGQVNDDGTFNVSVEPGRNALQFVSSQWQLTDKSRWTEKGVEVALGETKEVELRLSPRAGGFAALIAESLAEEAKAKGEPASSPPSGPPEMSLDLGDPEMDRISATVMAFPDDLLPAEPLAEDDLARVLDSVALVERKTIDGKQCITSIHVGAIEPMSELHNIGQALLIDYSVLAHISKYPHLESLLLVGAPGNDKWLESLRGNKRLQSLELVWSKNMTAAGVEILTTLPNLKHLGMLGPRLDDDAMRQLSRISTLETATFGGVITDGGIASLQNNSQLTALALLGFGESKLTDESLQSLGSLKKLESLEVIRTSGEQPFTDQGLLRLTDLAALKSLGIGGKGITDAGLVKLCRLKQLKNLTLLHTSVTQSGIDNLKKQLPALKVTRE